MYLSFGHHLFHNIIIYQPLGNHVCLTWTRFACSVACLEVVTPLSSYTRGRFSKTRCQSTMSKILVSCCENNLLLFMVAVFLLMLLLCGLMCIASMCCLLLVDGEFVFTIVVPDARIVFVLVAPLLLLLPSIFRWMTLTTVQGRAVSFAERVYMFYLQYLCFCGKRRFSVLVAGIPIGEHSNIDPHFSFKESTTRWFKVPILALWRSLNLWNGHLAIPKSSQRIAR